VPAILFLQSQTNPLLGFLPMLVIFAIFYFLLFMPMQRQRKQQKQMLASLQPGNVVQTSGGIIGTIMSVNSGDDTLVIRVKPDNVKLQVARSAVAGLITEK
jgi:preprotein translocase subunit YajC